MLIPIIVLGALAISLTTVVVVAIVVVRVCALDEEYTA